MASVAHELREPLVGARAALETVIEGGGGPDHRLLVRIYDELTHLLEVVDPLLRWSVGSRDLDRRSIDLVRLVRRVLASIAVEDNRLGDPIGRVRLMAPAAVVAVRADPTILEGAFANVLRNALAYSPPGAPIEVAVDVREGAAVVSIRDGGPGIPPGERDAVFEPFGRGRAGRRTRAGHGLGLFIARRIVEAHGGTIELVPSGFGATFCIRLPVEGRRPSSTS
ncbi:MAG: sensor histidine kinase [Candidatus Velamenicoccus archaeovorus]